jgi:protein O-GlcNAc transferase
VQLPDCYQVNDSTREISSRLPPRAELGLPEQGFVFCCFNHAWKINGRMFDIWMRLLTNVPGSVLWLFRSSEAAADNLRQAAQSRGVSADRLVFARFLEQPDHLARLPHADLFLDTLPYNAHTTASDALWAGVPVLTCAGQSFAGRVGASILRAAGLPELVTDDLADYEARALALANDPAQLQVLRRRLAETRAACPLFDTDRFRRHIEAAYVAMYEIWKGGQKPRGFRIDPIEA